MKQLVCVSGPHGGGKTTLIGRLLASPTLKEPANETDVLRTSVVAKDNGTQPATAAATTPPAAELKLDFLGNVTHALALVVVSKGLIAKELGSTKLTTQIFNADPAAIEALNAGGIDAA